MKRISELHEEWLRDDDYRKAYEALGPEFELVQALIQARGRALRRRNWSGVCKLRSRSLLA